MSKLVEKIKHTGVWMAVALALIFSSPVFFSSCGKDGDDNGDTLIEKLIGTWKLNQVTVNAMGQTTTMSAEEAMDLVRSMLGTNNVVFYDETLVITSTTINGYSFELSGKKLVSFGGSAVEGMTITVRDVKSDSFILRYDFGSSLIEDMLYVRQNLK